MKATSRRGEPLGLGPYLASLRHGKKLSLRQVEIACDGEVSNAYLSQLENARIVNPAPRILHALAEVYEVPYEKLMERAGYLQPADTRAETTRHGRAATYSVDNLTREEEAALLQYLAFVRSREGKGSDETR